MARLLPATITDLAALEAAMATTTPRTVAALARALGVSRWTLTRRLRQAPHEQQVVHAWLGGTSRAAQELRRRSGGRVAGYTDELAQRWEDSAAEADDRLTQAWAAVARLGHDHEDAAELIEQLPQADQDELAATTQTEAREAVVRWERQYQLSREAEVVP